MASASIGDAGMANGSDTGTGVVVFSLGGELPISISGDSQLGGGRGSETAGGVLVSVVAGGDRGGELVAVEMGRLVALVGVDGLDATSLSGFSSGTVASGSVVQIVVPSLFRSYSR